MVTLYANPPLIAVDTLEQEECRVRLTVDLSRAACVKFFLITRIFLLELAFFLFKVDFLKPVNAGRVRPLLYLSL